MKKLTIKALRELTPFLDERRLVLKGFGNAKQELAGYAEDALVDRIGDGYYHNVIAGDLDIYTAIKSSIKLPVLGHVSCLHMFGIITQIPQAITVYVVNQPDARQLDGVEYLHRDTAWVDQMMKKGGDGSFLKDHLPIFVIHPQLAHLDMLEHNDMSGLDPDDFDWEVMEDSFGITPIFELPESESTFDVR